MFRLFFNDFMQLDHHNTCTNKSRIKPVIESNNQSISQHTTFLRNKFTLVVDEENQKLPGIYRIPKLHKHSPKVVFILVDPQYSPNFL